MTERPGTGEFDIILIKDIQLVHTLIRPGKYKAWTLGKQTVIDWKGVTVALSEDEYRLVPEQLSLF